MTCDKAKLVYRNGWCVFWRELLYPFGCSLSEVADVASKFENRIFNPFTGYTIEQAEFLGYTKAGE